MRCRAPKEQMVLKAGQGVCLIPEVNVMMTYGLKDSNFKQLSFKVMKQFEGW